MGDLRRNQRAVTIATARATNPARSIPQMFLNPYDVKAAYSFFRHPEATPEALQLAHREVVFEQLHQPGQYLLLEDTSEMSWSGQQPIAGLGPIGSGAAGLQGFHLHSLLAVRWSCGRVRGNRRASPSCTSVPSLCGLRAPPRPGRGPGYLPPVRTTLVRVWEASPPPGTQALEWILLTDWPVENYAQALAVALVYATRWLIEEFHKALKTGHQAEDLQLETAVGLFAAIALKSVVALRLLDLRERVRLTPEAPAEESGFQEIELAVLRQVLRRPLQTVRAVALAIGRLGG